MQDITFLGDAFALTQDAIHFVFINDLVNADKLPDATGGVAYLIGPSVMPHIADYSIKKQDASQLRMLSYNVRRDDFFDADKEDNYRRILQAIAPDIIGFQEIYNHSSGETATKVASYLGGMWYHGEVSSDVLVVSRYPVLHSTPIGGNGAFILDLGGTNNQLLLLVAHPPCCANNMGRQREIDEMMAFVRDAKAGNGFPALAPNTPIVIMGDMNLVGFNEQQETLITGNIMDEASYGPDFQPDWDGTALGDAKPPATQLPMSFTWYNDNSSFSPGRLDYIVYTESVLELQNSYVLFTHSLPQDSLLLHGLELEDVIEASDHLPVVADFEQISSTAIGQDHLPFPFDLEIAPNPASLSTTLTYSLSESTTISLRLIDSKGRVIKVLDQGKKGQGTYTLSLDVAHLVKGVYQCHLVVGDGVLVKKVVVR